MRTFAILLCCLCFALAAVGQTPAKPPVAAEPRFDINNIDKSVNPCVDFYQFACAGWLRKNPIPPDYTDWVSFNEVQEHNYTVMKSILEKASANDPKRSAVQQKIGDFYSACMDEKAANKNGYLPLKPEFDRIAVVKDKTEMMEVIAHEALLGPNPIFGFGSGADFHDADMTIASIDQAGLTLPDRDYYLKDDPDMLAIRKTYVEHMKKMFSMIGETPDQAAKSADTIVKIETELAKAAMDRTLRRDPKNLDHKMTVAQISSTAPNFHLERYFAAIHTPEFKELNVVNPDFFKTVNPLIESTPLADWKTYMTWQMLNAAAAWLSDDFVNEDFKFQQALTGQQQIQARWKRCLNATDSSLGEALGQPYVDETFGTEGKQRMLKMVDALG